MSWITRSRLVMKDGISLKYLLMFHTETWDICHFILSSNVMLRLLFMCTVQFKILCVFGYNEMSIMNVYVIQALSQKLTPLNQGRTKDSHCETAASGIICQNLNGVLF